MENLKIVKGTSINSFGFNKYNELFIHTIDNTNNFNGSHIISREEIIKILSKFDYIPIKKRSRIHLHVDIDDWKVENKHNL